MKEEFRILSTTAILGYGFPLESFEEGMKRKPDLIAVDAGSTDPGPFYLGEGVSFTDRGAVKRDLEIMICAGIKENIPVVIGTAGGSGAKPHLEWCAEIIREIAKEHDLHFKMAMIHADMDKEEMKKALADGKITPLDPAPQLTAEDIDATTHIVGQMGIEPIMKALDSGVQVVLAGRAYDLPYLRLLRFARLCKGLAIHLGKVLECASICATPGSGSDCMFGYLGEDYFRVEPLSSVRKCTTLSVAAHTLYEKTNPYILPGPGGHLDLTNTTFEQDSENTVKVKGSRYVTAPKYTIKLEGAKCIGYRTVSVAGTRDPIMISKIDDIVEGVRARVADNYRDKGYKYNLNFTIYGKNGVMGNLEPVKNAHPHELGIVIEVVADTQEQADTICASARSTMLHYGYEGRRATAGNLAFPFSPSDFHAGRVYVFSIYHIIEVEDPTKLFPIDIVTL